MSAGSRLRRLFLLQHSPGVHFHFSRLYSNDSPFQRSLNIVRNEFIAMKSKMTRRKIDVDPTRIPPNCDILVVGAGAIGSSVGYWLKERALDGVSVVVLEKDPTVIKSPEERLEYAKNTSVLSVGGIRQQFSLKENIELSMFGAEFLRNIGMHLNVTGFEPTDVSFNPCGYMFLASEESAHVLKENVALQTELGAKVELLSPEKLKNKFPWMNIDGVALASHGLENEGWFDPYSLVFALKRKAQSLGADFVEGEVVGFNFMSSNHISDGVLACDNQHPKSAVVKMSDGTEQTIQFAILVIAAGSLSGKIGSLLGLRENEEEIFRSPITVEPRKRFVYNVHCPGGPGLKTPMLIDRTGAYIRREGLLDHYLVGMSPAIGDEEPSTDNLDVDYDFFENRVWPCIAHRVPAFENCKVKSAWAGFYDFNAFDENGFIGTHPGFNNVYLATGFSGHGIQQAPGVGRAVMELIVDGSFQTIDLTRLGYSRFIENEPLWESNIV